MRPRENEISVRKATSIRRVVAKYEKKGGGGGDSAHRFIMNGLSSWKQRKGSLATRENIAESDNRRLQKNRLNMAIWLLGDQKEDV